MTSSVTDVCELDGGGAIARKKTGGELERVKE